MKKIVQTAHTHTDAKYDIMKFCMSIMVLAIHAELFPYVLYPWLRMAVPLFFITTSYFLFGKLMKADDQTQKNILAKFAARNAKLYLGWFVILLPLTLVIRRREYFMNGLGAGVAAFLKGMCFGSTFVASWYITASVIGVIVIFLLCKYIKKEYILWGFSSFAFFVVTMESSYPEVMAGTWLSNGIQAYIDVFGGLVCSFPASFMWILVGRWFARQKNAARFSRFAVPVFLVSCVGLYMEWKFVIRLNGTYNNDSYFMLFPVCTSFFAMLQSVKPVQLSTGVYLRHASTVIYAVHGSIVYAIGFAMEHFLHMESSVVKFAVTFVCCIVVHVCIECGCTYFSEHRIGKILKSLY